MSTKVVITGTFYTNQRKAEAEIDRKNNRAGYGRYTILAVENGYIVVERSQLTPNT